MAKIILHSYYCDLDSYRNDDFELAIDLPCNVNAALSKKLEEISNLDSIISDFTTSFEILLGSRELNIFSRLEYALSNNGRFVYSATLELDGIQAIDGQLYIDKTSERIVDGLTSYNVQLIGTHQTWKEQFRGQTFADLDLGEIEWTISNIEDLWQNNTSYSDGGSVIYPLLANFGEWFGNVFSLAYSATLYDVRFIVYKLAILQKMFCQAGYKIKSSFLNSDAFRNQANYLLELNFGQESTTDIGPETIMELSVDTTNNTGLNIQIPWDITIKDRLTLYNPITFSYDNLTTRWITDLKIDLDLTFCNLNAFPSYFGVAIFISDSISSPILPSPGYYIVPEFDFRITSVAVGACVSRQVTIDIAQLLRDNLVNGGYFEDTWKVSILTMGFGVSSPRCTLMAGSTVRFYPPAPNHFNESDIIQISNVLDNTISLYDFIQDEKTLHNLRFRTIESEKIVEIEPYPSRYETYETLNSPSYTANGFLGYENNPVDVIDITENVDVCQLVEKSFPNVNINQYFYFKFKDSSDKYSKYILSFPNETNPLFANDTSDGQQNVQVTTIQLKLYQPTLNDYDFEISNVADYGVYIPFMWETELQEGASENPDPGTNLGIRTFCVFGWQPQAYQFADTYNDIGFYFEGNSYNFVPNVGQLFEAIMLLAPLTYGVPLQNNVFKDNLSSIPQTKNHVNTYFQFDISQVNAIEFDLEIYSNNLFFYQMNVRKLIRIFSEQSNLIRFNGNYQWLQIIKNMNENKAIITLKPILPCNG